MPTNSRARLWLFGGLYFAQGIPWGFFTVALMLRLTTLKVSAAGLGDLLFWTWLAWTGKPLLGPLVDALPMTRWGRRRPFILVAELAMAVTLVILATVNPLQSMGWFTALLFLHNVAAAAQDVGTDALAIDLLRPEERGRANGIMSAAKFAGMVVGGQGLLWVADRAGWPMAFGAAVVLLLVPSTLVFFVDETAATVPPRIGWRDTFAALSKRAAILAAVFALLADWCESLVFPLTYPLFNQQLGFSEQQLASLSTVGSLAAALASLAGGVLCDRYGRRLILALGCVGTAALYLGFAFAHAAWVHFSVVAAFMILGGVAAGITNSALLALFMDVTDRRLAATQFQVFMAIFNGHTALASRVGGRLSERLSAPAMFGVGAVVQVLPLFLLAWLGRPAAEAAVADSDASARS